MTKLPKKTKPNDPARPSLAELKPKVDGARDRLNRLRRELAGFFVDKQEVIDLMVICALAQEPLLLIGRPGTAKSELVVRFCEALGLADGEYFEYMLTQFTEPSEIVGPIDLAKLKEGQYLRRTEGKLPEASVVFLDEIFKSNSAILNTLLTIINERKFYQDGKAVPVRLKALFAAANEIPEHTELAALRDRFALKVESRSVRAAHFDALVEKGMRSESLKAFNHKPWAKLASLEDLTTLKAYLDQTLTFGPQGPGHGDAPPLTHHFPKAEQDLFRRIIRTIEADLHIEITDRRVVKLVKLILTRATLLHGGEVRREDLQLLRYVGDRVQDLEPLRQLVDRLLALG